MDAVGFGFVLIRKPVIEALEFPFTTRTSKGEDIAFCENAKAAGFSIKVNTAAKVGHILTVPLIIDESNAGPEFGDRRPAAAAAGGMKHPAMERSSIWHHG